MREMRRPPNNHCFKSRFEQSKRLFIMSFLIIDYKNNYQNKLCTAPQIFSAT